MKNHFNKWLWQGNLCIYFLLLLIFPLTICGFCLRQKDICFLLAMGRCIVEQGHLPTADPFSWTYSIFPNGAPYVIHQWLTDLIFYGAIEFFKANSLIWLTVVIFTLAFLLIPLQIMRLLRLSQIQALSLASISMFAACSHLQTRPEIFSFVFIACYFFVLVKADKQQKLSVFDLLILFLIMILWCNLHSGFLAGLAIVCFWAVFSFIDQAILLRRKFNLKYFAAVPVCLAASFVNPYGYKLWLYLPYLYWSPVCKYLPEWRTFDWDFFLYPIWYPFFILSLLNVSLCYRSIKIGGLRIIGSKPFVLGLSAIMIGLKASRFMNISAIAIIVSSAILQAFINDNKDRQDEDNARFNLYGWQFSVLSSAIISIVAFFITTNVMPAEIPEGDGGFKVPLAAIEFLKQHPQEGKLLNESQYGDVLLWHMQPAPKLFIDTRFDLYAPDMVDKYYCIAECQDGWQQCLQQLNCDWLFFPPQTPIIKALEKDPRWAIVYKDQAAVIIRKK